MAIRPLAPVAALALAGLALAAPAAAAKPPAPVPAAPTEAEAWTARLIAPVTARTAPRRSARARVRLSPYTDHWRLPHTLLVLARPVTDAGGRAWLKVRLPDRPNGSSGWIPARVAKLTRTTVRVRVRIGARRVELLRGGRRVAAFRAAVGTGRTPTPTGLFAVHDPVPTTPANRGAYGPFVLTLTAHSAVLRSFLGGDGLVGIHGTSATSLLGSAASNGCVRLSNTAIRRLRAAVAPGTPVEIIP